MYGSYKPIGHSCHITWGKEADLGHDVNTSKGVPTTASRRLHTEPKQSHGGQSTLRPQKGRTRARLIDMTADLGSARSNLHKEPQLPDCSEGICQLNLPDVDIRVFETPADERFDFLDY